MPAIRENIMSQNDFTDFGFEQVSPQEKTKRVYHVFESVADNYDLMNDLMSFGVHRLWKRFAVHLAAPKPGAKILDVAGGTGDLARLYHPRLGANGSIVICDINYEMLSTGRDRLLDKGLDTKISYIQGNGESLPFTDNTFDLISIAFGLRNITDKQRALVSMYEKLKFGGQLLILEFSTVAIPLLQNIYDRYSYECIPLIGKYVARDEPSYRYLVESIRMHPDQDTLKGMMESAGFARVEYHNLSGGIVAIHKGYKL